MAHGARGQGPTGLAKILGVGALAGAIMLGYCGYKKVSGYTHAHAGQDAGIPSVVADINGDGIDDTARVIRVPDRWGKKTGYMLVEVEVSQKVKKPKRNKTLNEIFGPDEEVVTCTANIATDKDMYDAGDAVIEVGPGKYKPLIVATERSIGHQWAGKDGQMHRLYLQFVPPGPGEQYGHVAYHQFNGKVRELPLRPKDVKQHL